MRSLTGCRAANMDRLFWCSLLLNFLKLTEGNTNSKSCNLSQPDEVLWRKIGQSVELPCAISSGCSGTGWQYEWLTCKESVCFRLKLPEYPQKYKLNKASLQITALLANDSGIYHCAAVSGGHQAQGSQHVGLGTTLVVRENIKTMVRHIYLWICFVLVFVYTLAVVTLIVKMYGCQRIHKLDQFNLTKRTQFHDVLQEMHNKKKLRKVKKAASEEKPQAGPERKDGQG
ncbi:immunoglobulin superfamily member 6 isoform X2 [Nelusetta ayraudi]|uniref:immunoglobulin superfamily member 6 isoform X2 n=1 Tax=Nelusetta ayraudi TaxID=303726 RepID=UPI003F6F2533